MFARLPLAPGLRVGLFGGSFNPAHAGHVHVAETALQRLSLDRVVWLVSPQNPLKDARESAPLADRVAGARALARHPGFIVSDIETHLSTRYSADTLRYLLQRHPAVRFVWIMGADNLVGFHRWDRWDWIMESVPVAVIARPGYMRRAASSPAAIRYRRARVSDDAAATLALRQAPAWTLLRDRLVPLSSTAIRAGLLRRKR